MSKPSGWRQEMTWVTILYHMAEKKMKISANAAGRLSPAMRDELQAMDQAFLINNTDNDSDYWVTKDGKADLKKIVQMFDHVRHFEVFGAVDLGCKLDPEIIHPEYPELVKDEYYDPRFNGELNAAGVEDCRLAMITYYSTLTQKEQPTELDPRRVVFIQKLVDDEFQKASNDFWTNLLNGTFFDKVEEIVNSAYRWQDLGVNEEKALFAASMLYKAGMIEDKKCQGNKCSNCEMPLAMYELEGELHVCPRCQNHFDGPPPEAAREEDVCPSCETIIPPRARQCPGCGANIDRSLAAGTVQTDTIVTEEVVEEVVPNYFDNGYYGYDPYPCYYPFDPLRDALAFGILCAVIF